MKKIFLSISIFMCTLALALVSLCAGGYSAYADSGLSGEAKSAYLVDYNTGTVLYERNSEEKLQIASMVKIVTLCITFENLENGNLSYDEMICISKEASGMGGSQMFLDTGKEYSVSDLIKGITVCSANDASVALAERIAGSKEAFISLMNEKAAEMGMENTVFVNVTGLPAEGQYSTAKDVTTMMQHLLSNKEYYNYSTIYMEDYVHPGGRITGLVNTNKLIKSYKGCDAGKTGFTNAAMFCISASAERNGMRVISTVVGSPSSQSRFKEVTSMFDYAFAVAKQVKLVDHNESIANEIVVKGGMQDNLDVVAKRDVFCLEVKG
ncbi:MAG: D-alanyl-D-alanine carboxypeptidase family protein, partial [Bacillota bacterium]